MRRAPATPIVAILMGTSVVVLASLVVFMWRMQILANNANSASVRAMTMTQAMSAAKDARFFALQIQQFLIDAGASAATKAIREDTDSRNQALVKLRLLVELMPEDRRRIEGLRPEIVYLHKVGLETAQARAGRPAGNAIIQRRGDGLNDTALRVTRLIDDLVSDIDVRQQAAQAQATQSVVRMAAMTKAMSLLLVLLALGLMLLISFRFIALQRGSEVSAAIDATAPARSVGSGETVARCADPCSDSCLAKTYMAVQPAPVEMVPARSTAALLQPAPRAAGSWETATPHQPVSVAEETSTDAKQMQALMDLIRVQDPKTRR